MSHDQAAERSWEKPQDDFVHPDRPGDLRQELWETFSSAGIIALVMKDEDCQELPGTNITVGLPPSPQL